MTQYIQMKAKKALQIAITGFVEKEDSGMVIVEFTDYKGKKWSFPGKPAMFTKQEMNASTEFPQTGKLPCAIEAKRLDSQGKMVLLVHTARWKVENAEFGGYYEVFENQVVDP